eukprot:TRINITY_DN39713_c0_g1_i2.p1 TRINITY_DN39713_c0_g1~~TRINITY_DN39713_c0_g1_i2.p1  ORF type:complete len:675 (-),score=92.68 TRINITY_DN39713_c0_g1_i2:26-2050(-)
MLWQRAWLLLPTSGAYVELPSHSRARQQTIGGHVHVLKEPLVLEALSRLETTPELPWPYLRLAFALYSGVKEASEGSPTKEEGDEVHLGRLQIAASLVEVMLPYLLLVRDVTQNTTLLHKASWLYKKVRSKLYSKVFSSVPDRLRLVPITQGEPPLDIVVNAIGSYGGNAGPTLRSLLAHTSRLLKIHVLGDAEGWRSFSAVVDLLPSDLAARAEFAFVHLWEHPRYLQRLVELPRGCLNSFMGHSAYIRGIFMHEVLSESIEKAIYIDIGDVLVFGDIAEFWGLFHKFTDRQLVGVALESGRFRTRASRLYSSGGRAFPGWHEDKWINTGVLLLDLARQRQRDWTGQVLRLSWEDPDRCSQADMSLLGWAMLLQPEVWFEVPSAWHYVPSAYWQIAEHDLGHVAKDWPKELRDFQLFPGLFGVRDMRHACPQWPELVGSQVLVNQQAAQLTAPIAMLHGNTGRGLYFSGDTACGQRVKLLHMVSHYKWLPWARKLLAWWGHGLGLPPEVLGTTYGGNLLQNEAPGMGDRLQAQLCRSALAAPGGGLRWPGNSSADDACADASADLLGVPPDAHACYVGDSVQGFFNPPGEGGYWDLATIAAIEDGKVVVDWADMGRRGRWNPVEKLRRLDGQTPCSFVRARSLLEVSAWTPCFTFLPYGVSFLEGRLFCVVGR